MGLHRKAVRFLEALSLFPLAFEEAAAYIRKFQPLLIAIAGKSQSWSLFTS